MEPSSLQNEGDNVNYGEMAYDAVNTHPSDLEMLRHALAADPHCLHYTDHNGSTLLNIAIAFGKLEAMRMLLRAGADPNHVVRGSTPIHVLAMNANAFLGNVTLAGLTKRYCGSV